MVGEKIPFHGIAGDFDEGWRVPAIAAEQRDLDVQLAGLAGDEAGLVVVACHEDGFGIGAADRSELGFEILIARAVALLADDGAAVFCEVVFEEIRESHGVVLFHIREDGRLCPTALEHELREDRALEGIDEANAEDVVSGLRDLGICRGGRDHGDFVLLADGCRFQRTGGRDLADDGDRFFA